MGFLDNLPFFRRAAASPEASPTELVAAAAEVEPDPTPEAATAPVEAPATETTAVAAEPGSAAPVAAPAEPEAQAAPVPPAVPTPTTPAPDAATRAEAEALVRAVARELPNFVAVAVLAQAEGRILAGQWAGHSGGAVEAATADAEVVRQTQLMLQAQQPDSDEQLQNIVVTLPRQLQLLQVLPRQSWLLYLAIPSQSTNLALARAVLQNLTQ